MTLREYSAMDTSAPFVAHHGILGMHWGIRRTPAQLGYPTPKPRKLEKGKTGDYKNDGETVKQTYGKGKTRMIQSRNEGGSSKSTDNSKLASVAKKPSKHRERLISSYMRNKGMTQEEAETAADKRIKNEKRALIGAGVAITAAAAYVAARHYINENVDQVLKEGTEMKRIVRGDDDSVKEGRAIYLAWNKKDTQRYEGLLAPDLFKTERVYDENGFVKDLKAVNPKQLTINAKSNLKIASNKSARNTFNELYDNDSEFKDYVQKHVGKLRQAALFGGATEKQKEVLNRAANDVAKNTKSKSLYTMFNYGMVDHSPESQKQINKFYNALKNKGYAGVADINDRKLSGYNAKSATIMFDTGKLAVSKVREMNMSELSSAKTRETAKLVREMSTPQLVKNIALTGGLIGAGAAIGNASNQKIIDNYVKYHPNTKLTDKQILDMYKQKKT